MLADVLVQVRGKEKSFVPSAFETSSEFRRVEGWLNWSAVLALCDCAKFWAPTVSIVDAACAWGVVGVFIEGSFEIGVDVFDVVTVLVFQRVKSA